MDYTELRQSVEQRLAVLADTEHNRKKKRIEADLDSCLGQIGTKETELEEAIATDRYDDAVTIKETLSKLTSKAEMLNDTFNQLNSIPVYDDADLRVISWEITDFFALEVAKNLKCRLEILKGLYDNEQITKGIFDSYWEIKKLVDDKSNAPNRNYDHHYDLGGYGGYSNVKYIDELKYKLENTIENLERKGTHH